MFSFALRPARQLWIPILLMLLIGCTKERSQDLPSIPPPPKPGASTRPPRGTLRVSNVGVEAVFGLAVVFPQDTVSFGDVQPGETTNYQDVHNGVFRYGGLRYVRNGRPVTQGVVDFMEMPQAGNFTYLMRFADIEVGTDLIRNLLTIQTVIHDQ
jgi:hypothetical protein